MSSLEKFSVPEGESKRRTREEIKGYFAGLERIEDDDSEREGEQPLVPDGLTDTVAFSKESGDAHARELYDWYSRAMRRRNREPLSEEGFIGHFFESGSAEATYCFGDPERGYLLGVVNYGVFIPTHFAPKSIRTGYELMKELGGSEEIPAVLAITEDLAETLKKMPEWQAVDTHFLARFREELAEKQIVHNSHPGVRRLIVGLMSEYLERTHGAEEETPSETAA